MQQEVTKWKKSQTEIYNAQICYERVNMEEDSDIRLLGSLLAHYILEDFREDFSKVFRSLA